MRESRAFCPASLGFIFKICPHKNLTKMGSVGIGCTVNKGVRVKVQKASKTTIFLNKKAIFFPTVLTAINALTSQPVSVAIESYLPLGFGFGISSASTLSTIWAVNKLFGLNKTELELAKTAHIAEIKNKTGLGSVATQITGGFLLKRSPGLPVKAVKLAFIGKKLYAVIIGKLLTPSILNDKNRIRQINMAGNEALNFIKKEKIKSLGEILDISYHFIKESGLLTNWEVVRLINNIKQTGGHASMAILGQVVISDTIPKIIKYYRIEELTITNNTVTLT